MSSQSAMSLMTVMETALWTIFAVLFLVRGLHRRFPAMGIYLTLNAVASPVLLALYRGLLRHGYNDWCYFCYVYIYWTVYIASAVLLFFICIEIFRSMLSSFSGLQRLGTLAFRWVVLVSVIVSLSSLTFDPTRVLFLHTIAHGLMRSVSLLELFLLAFLCLSMNALRISVRDLPFGIALGLGTMSASDLIVASFIFRPASLTTLGQFVCESLILLALGIWVVYAALPEPAREPVMMPINSLLFRWNEIAMALGHTGTQVAMQQQTSGFFLTDAEQVVDKTLGRRLAGPDQ
ncbi:MAG: hypothetical protein ABR907_03660 [Terracidiphilus sp.]|jgi:hypothetical protein